MTAEPHPEELRDRFVGWQCRIRAQAMRREGGRPQPAMRAQALRAEGGEIAPALTVLLVERESADSTAMFRHVCRKTQDPRIRYQEAIKVLAATYYMHPNKFSDSLAATFSNDSEVAAALLAGRRCELRFAQFNQSYRLPCDVAKVSSEDEIWQATYWHNAMFNPALPPDLRVLVFTPRWQCAEAEPAP